MFNFLLYVFKVGGINAVTGSNLGSKAVVQFMKEKNHSNAMFAAQVMDKKVIETKISISSVHEGKKPFKCDGYAVQIELVSKL